MNVDKLPAKIVEVEHEIESVRDRIRDLEWRLERGHIGVEEEARTKAVTKLRYLMDELLALKLEWTHKTGDFA